jgi:hypothetical protein
MSIFGSLDRILNLSANELESKFHIWRKTVLLLEQRVDTLYAEKEPDQEEIDRVKDCLEEARRKLDEIRTARMRGQISAVTTEKQ